jgi:hypothetical protein
MQQNNDGPRHQEESDEQVDIIVQPQKDVSEFHDEIFVQVFRIMHVMWVVMRI